MVSGAINRSWLRSHAALERADVHIDGAAFLATSSGVWNHLRRNLPVCSLRHWESSLVLRLCGTWLFSACSFRLCLVLQGVGSHVATHMAGNIGIASIGLPVGCMYSVLMLFLFARRP